MVAHCKSKNLNIHFLHYKYLYNLIDGKKNTTVDKWDITSDYVQNDTKLMQQTKGSKRSSNIEDVRKTKKMKSTEQETCTIILERDEETVVETMATCSDDPSKDDIQVLEDKRLTARTI